MADDNGSVSLRKARERTGLSREKAAAAINISSKTLERWEDPDRRPARLRRYKLAELAELYGIDVGQFEEAA